MPAERISLGCFPQRADVDSLYEVDCGLHRAYTFRVSSKMLPPHFGTDFFQTEEPRTGNNFQAVPFCFNRFAAIDPSRTLQGYVVAKDRRSPNHVHLHMLPL
jgi:hypothetical protein